MTNDTCLLKQSRNPRKCHVWASSQLALAMVLIFSGCASAKKSLQNVNKDWNKAIRAAHIYPVSPLTQDLQPGDIFVTDRTIEDLSAWDSTGYLPLDHGIVRLYPNGYVDFYSHSFGVPKSGGFLPQEWLKDNSWSNAPVAAFPGYTFKINQGGAMNVSLPIQGVPVGLGLMGAKSASGTVTITDAHTYGVDEISLLQQVENFVNIPTNAANLLKHLPGGGETDTNRYFLQVVSRVFVTGRVIVSMLNDSSSGGSLTVGSAPAATIPSLSQTNAAANYSNMVSAVNAIVQSAPSGASPGGSLKFTQVSARSVSMDETFTKPVVIGYTGFSVQIDREKLKQIAEGRVPKGAGGQNAITLGRIELDPRARNRQLSKH